MDETRRKIIEYCDEQAVWVENNTPPNKWCSYTHSTPHKIGYRGTHAPKAFQALSGVLSVLDSVVAEGEVGLMNDILDAIEEAFE